MLDISSISKNKLEIQMFKVVHTYKVGTLQEEMFKDQNTISKHSNKLNQILKLGYIVI